jgi:hypothetical protein
VIPLRHVWSLLEVEVVEEEEEEERVQEEAEDPILRAVEDEVELEVPISSREILDLTVLLTANIYIVYNIFCMHKSM